MSVSLLYKSNCILGEGASWHSVRKSFFWVDIEGKTVYEYNLQKKKAAHWQVPHRVSFLLEAEKDTMLLALQGGLAWLDLRTGKLDRLLDIEKTIPTNRTNDGACDTEGRLWIGTMDLECKPERGALYSIDSELRLQKKLDRLTIPNGMAWSPDNKQMYHIDTATGSVSSYSFNAATGDISFERTAVTVPPEMGAPDGMCMDEEGMLWIAHWGGSGVYRWNPENGLLLDKLEIPAPQVTCCAFGGENLEQLFITTAKEGLAPEQLEKHPESGDVFIAIPGVKGIPRNKFSGHKKIITY